MRNVDELEQYFRGLEARDEFSGVVLATRGDATLFSGAYGYASRTWQVSNSLEMRFDTASITKLFTAVATLQLIDQKLLAFDTPIVDFLGLQGTNIAPAVTIFHLLTHTSGIGDDADEENGERYEDLWKTRPNYAVTTTADFLPQFVYKSPNFPPGQGCRYCNCGFVLLGLAIEKVSGLAYRDYVRRHIFARAGMAHSDFFHQERVNPLVAEGSDPIRDDAGAITGWKKNIYAYPPVGSPDGGAHVTAGDLDRFLRAVKQGELLSPQLTAAFFTPQVHYRTMKGWDKHFGFGLWFYVDGAGQVVCCEKEGVNVGVSGAIRHFPQDDINVVILSNMEEGVWSPIWQLHEMVVSGLFN
jgi:CubicO group peptidase (beta-lactamase class C family)